MNILFLLKSFEIGGLEVVTTVLANKFAAEGHGVIIWAFYEGKTSLADRLDKRVKLVYGKGFNAGRENVESLRQTLKHNDVQVAINQWGLPYVPARTLKAAMQGLDVKVIAVYHNDPLANGRTKGIELDLERCDNPAKRTYLRLKKWLFRSITSASMRYIYNNSDIFMVLSDSFVKHFEDYTGVRNATKLVVQTNPVTIDTEGFAIDYGKKSREILFVGRLDHSQKRVHRILETWALLEADCEDWQLTIVGDGPERDNLESLSRYLGLQRVNFEGYKPPRAYYERASVLVLTSEFEGFPLVIAEGMSFGVVPVVYGSYSAVSDIIADGENGLVVKPQPYGFDANDMAEALKGLMTSVEKRSRMAEKAIETSKRYAVDTIYHQWEGLFSTLLSKKA